MSSVVETVTKLVTPILEEKDMELVDIEFVKEGKNRFLRVFIDKAGGIDIEECALVSEQLSEQLDQLEPDPIPYAYFLEVSSPGAERPLKKEADYQKALNQYVHLSFYQAVDGVKQLEGVLKQVDADQLTIQIKQKTRTIDCVIDRKNIAKARLAIQF